MREDVEVCEGVFYALVEIRPVGLFVVYIGLFGCHFYGLSWEFYANRQVIRGEFIECVP